MPNKSVVTLMLCVLVVVTSELQTAGMMPYLAQGLNVNVGSVGVLVTVYALGMALGGPTIVFFGRKYPPRSSLLGAMLTYSVLEVATIMHSSMAWLVAARFLTGSLSGAVFGLALSFAARIAPTPATIPKNIAFVLNGLMLGGIIGMPLSHAIADSFGWQWSFILLGILALATSIIVGTTLPRLHATNQHDDSKDRRQLKNKTLWIRYAISLLTIGSVYAGFSFFTPVLQNEAGFSANTTSALLLIYGIFTLIGNFMVGNIAHKAATTILLSGHAVILVAMGTIYLFSEVKIATVLAVLAVGLFGVTLNPALVARVTEIGGAGNMVTSVHTGVITLGVTVGTALSSLVLEKSNGIASNSGIVSVLLAAGAGVLTFASMHRAKPSTKANPPDEITTVY